MIGDCTLCGASVEPDGERETCTGCGHAPKPYQSKPDRAAISTAVRESRTRRLLGPSCLGRRHTRCTASGCQCTCHPDQRPRRPDASA